MMMICGVCGLRLNKGCSQTFIARCFAGWTTGTDFPWKTSGRLRTEPNKNSTKYH